MRNRLRFRRCSVVWIFAFLLSSSSNTHGFLQWQAVWSSRMKNTRDGFCTANQLSDLSSRMKNTRHSYRKANHLSVPASIGIGPLSFCTLSLRPTFESLKLVTVIPSQILLGIPQIRFRLSRSQECCLLVLAYTTKVLISSSDALLSGETMWIVIRDPREYTPTVVQWLRWTSCRRLCGCQARGSWLSEYWR